MVPVTQTRLYDPNAPAGEQRGNCWTACIASLLVLEISDVPDFVQIDVDGGENWWDHTLRFLAERGYYLQWVDANEPGEGYYIQCGLSPRSPGEGGEVHHSVIYQHGLLVHDPHPDRTGLRSITEAYRIVSQRRGKADHDGRWPEVLVSER